MGMIKDLLFSHKLGPLSKKVLNFKAQRALLVSANIANVETPGYKAVDLKPFEADLRMAMSKSKSVAMTTTDSRHIHGTLNEIKNFQAEVIESTDPAKLDGNNVNLDKEVAKMTQNSLEYQMIMAAKARLGKTKGYAIEGGQGN